MRPNGIGQSFVCSEVVGNNLNRRYFYRENSKRQFIRCNDFPEQAQNYCISQAYQGERNQFMCNKSAGIYNSNIYDQTSLSCNITEPTFCDSRRYAVECQEIPEQTQNCYTDLNSPSPTCSYRPISQDGPVNTFQCMENKCSLDDQNFCKTNLRDLIKYKKALEESQDLCRQQVCLEESQALCREQIYIYCPWTPKKARVCVEPIQEPTRLPRLIERNIPEPKPIEKIKKVTKIPSKQDLPKPPVIKKPKKKGEKPLKREKPKAKEKPLKICCEPQTPKEEHKKIIEIEQEPIVIPPRKTVVKVDPPMMLPPKPIPSIIKETKVEDPPPPEPCKPKPKPKQHCCPKQRQCPEHYTCYCSPCVETNPNFCAEDLEDIEEEEEEEDDTPFGMPCCSHSSCKYRKPCPNCCKPPLTQEFNEEDPCGEFFDVIRETMEEAVQKSIEDVFGRYFDCCIDKIDKLTCRMEQTECLLKNIHKDMKDRISFYGRRSAQQFQYLCGRMEQDRILHQKQQECLMNLWRSQCRPKSRSTKNYCERRFTSSSNDSICSSDGRQCGKHPIIQSEKGECEPRNNFREVKSQFWKSPQQEDTETCKSHFVLSSQSCDDEEFVINETELTNSEPRTTQSKTSKLGNRGKLERKQSQASSGSMISRKVKSRQNFS